MGEPTLGDRMSSHLSFHPRRSNFCLKGMESFVLLCLKCDSHQELPSTVYSLYEKGGVTEGHVKDRDRS